MASRVGPKQKTLTFKDGNISIGPSLTVSIIIRQNIHLPTAPAYTVIKHDGHLRTRGKCRKHGSCLLWVMSTEISVDIAVDIAVDTRSTVSR